MRSFKDMGGLSMDLPSTDIFENYQSS